jgi:hypothetical protein
LAWCGALAEAGEAGPVRPTVLLYAGADFWRQGGFSHGGALWAPAGLDRSGAVLKAMVGGGIYRYTSGALGNIAVRGQALAGSLQAGWRQVYGKLFVTGFLGADVQRHRLTPDDPSAGLRGSYLGLRTGFELWYEPTDATMIVADASVSTIGPSYNARIAAGWRAFARFYLGPEVQAFAADDNYSQFRAGLHLTGLRMGDFEWSLGLGWATDSDDESSLYARIGVFTRL